MQIGWNERLSFENVHEMKSKHSSATKIEFLASGVLQTNV